MFECRNEIKAEEVSVEEAQEAVADLIADARFRLSDRGKSILRYLADLYAPGDTQGVKGYAIAVDVLGRPESFDPTSDPIARIEVGRLRTALVQFYEAHGHEQPIEIRIPIGKYRLIFVRRRQQDRNFSMTKPPVTPNMSPIKPVSLIKRRFAVFVLSSGAIASVIVLSLLYFLTRREVMTFKPIVAIAFQADKPPSLEAATKLRDLVYMALLNFHTLRLRDEGVVGQQPWIEEPQYILRLRYRMEEKSESLWWQVEDKTDNVLVGSGVEKTSGSGQSVNQERMALASTISQKIAASNGLIDVRLVNKTSETVPGNVCVVKAEIALARALDLSNNIGCLEKTLKRNSQDSDAMAALSRIIGRLSNGKPSSLSRSLELAQNAVFISPLSDRTLFSLMEAYLRNGKMEQAAATAEQALSLNPNNQDLRAAALIAFPDRDWHLQRINETGW